MSTRPWIKSYGDVIPATINPDSVASVRDLLDGAMKTFADKPAFRSFGQTMTRYNRIAILDVEALSQFAAGGQFGGPHQPTRAQRKPRGR